MFIDILPFDESLLVLKNVIVSTVVSNMGTESEFLQNAWIKFLHKKIKMDSD